MDRSVEPPKKVQRTDDELLRFISVKLHECRTGFGSELDMGVKNESKYEIIDTASNVFGNEELSAAAVNFLLWLCYSLHAPDSLEKYQVTISGRMRGGATDFVVYFFTNGELNPSFESRESDNFWLDKRLEE